MSMSPMNQTSFNRLRLFYFVFFSSLGCFWPYIILFFKKLGFTGHELGFLVAIGYFVMILAQPVWGMINDRTKSSNRMIILVSLIAVLLCLSFWIPEKFPYFMLLMGIFTFFSFSIIPIIDTITIQSVKGSTYNYGQVRAWGSLGYCVMVIIVGWLSEFSIFGQWYQYFHPGLSLQVIQSLKGLPSTMLVYAAVMLVTMCLAFFLPSYTKPKQTQESKGHLLALLKNPRYSMFLFGVFLAMVAMNSNSMYFGLYLDYLKGSTTLLGVAMMLAALGEVPVFLYASRLLTKLSPLNLLVIAASSGALRWYLYTQITSPYVALCLQPLHAINFGCYYVGAIHFVDSETPREWKTTGQSIFWAIGYGFSAIVGNLIGGHIIQVFGIISLYKFGTICAVLATFIFLMIDSFFPKKNEYIV